jgi:hypothetical protein
MFKFLAERKMRMNHEEVINRNEIETAREQSDLKALQSKQAELKRVSAYQQYLAQKAANEAVEAAGNSIRQAEERHRKAKAERLGAIEASADPVIERTRIRLYDLRQSAFAGVKTRHEIKLDNFTGTRAATAYTNQTSVEKRVAAIDAAIKRCGELKYIPAINAAAECRALLNNLPEIDDELSEKFPVPVTIAEDSRA